MRHAGALAARDALDAQALALLANAFSRMPLGSARAEAAALRPLFLAARRAPTGAFAAQHASSLLNAAAAARVRDPALTVHLALALEAQIDAACGFLPRHPPPAGGAPGARVSPQSVALTFHALAVLDLGDQAPPRPAPPDPLYTRGRTLWDSRLPVGAHGSRMHKIRSAPEDSRRGGACRAAPRAD